MPNGRAVEIARGHFDLGIVMLYHMGMRDGFVKVAAASPDLKVADPAYNAGEIVAIIRKAEALGVKILVFPELSVTGYTCGDLFFQKSLQNSAEDALLSIVKDSAFTDALIFVGYPFLNKGKLYNTAAVIKGGKVLALIPKKNLPSYGEFYETRWFTPAPDKNEKAELFGNDVIFGNKVIFDADIPSSLSIGCEICEDLWVPESPSIRLALNGATVVVNPSASDEIIGKEEYRKINEFLTANQNKKILFLELGVGRMTPMFIQEPFWNLTYSLPQAYYITINPKDALLPQALSQKGWAIKEDIAAVLQDAAAHMSGKEDSSCMI